MTRQKICIEGCTLLVCIAAGWLLLLFPGPLTAAEDSIEGNATAAVVDAPVGDADWKTTGDGPQFDPVAVRVSK